MENYLVKVSDVLDLIEILAINLKLVYIYGTCHRFLLDLTVEL